MDQFCEKYDDEWFSTHRLVLAVIEAPSGSYEYAIDEVRRTDDGKVYVYWNRKAPPSGILTCDIMYWFHMIELDNTDFDPSDTVTVEKQFDPSERITRPTGS